MANLAMEMGSKCVFVPPDEKTAEYLRPRLKDPATQYQPVYADADAVYEQEIRVDLAQLEPMVACPHQVENTKPVTEVAGTRIDQAFLGSCANGKYEDLAVAAQILRGRKVDRACPPDRDARVAADSAGSDAVRGTADAGGEWRLVTNPGCGACAGDGGTMADGEVSLSTANRNFIGRMGSTKSSIYLSSPATLAASAFQGRDCRSPGILLRRDARCQRHIEGRVFKFGDNVNSDIIIAGRYLIYIDPKELAQHAFEMLGEGFPARLTQYDILVAGRNFGCGSAREQASTAIKGLGIQAVVAASFARTFYRNAINDGLTIVECPELYAAVAEGDRIAIELASGRITHQGREYSFPQMPDSVRKILELGGLANYLKANLPAGS